MPCSAHARAYSTHTGRRHACRLYVQTAGAPSGDLLRGSLGRYAPSRHHAFNAYARTCTSSMAGGHAPGHCRIACMHVACRACRSAAYEGGIAFTPQACHGPWAACHVPLLPMPSCPCRAAQRQKQPASASPPLRAQPCHRCTTSESRPRGGQRGCGSRLSAYGGRIQGFGMRDSCTAARRRGFRMRVPRTRVQDSRIQASNPMSCNLSPNRTFCKTGLRPGTDTLW